MINQRDRDIIEREVGKMVERSNISSAQFAWNIMEFRFYTPYDDDELRRISFEGDTTDEIIEAIRTDVNQILQDMIDTLEASKLDYKFGKGGVTV